MQRKREIVIFFFIEYWIVVAVINIFLLNNTRPFCRPGQR